MKIKQMDHFVLSVADLEKSVHFYQDLVGLPLVKEKSSSYTAVFRCGSSLLKLRMASNPANAIVAKHLVPGAFDFCFECQQSAEQIEQALQDKGAKIIKGPVATQGSKGKMTSVYVRDPDGNLVEFSTYQN